MTQNEARERLGLSRVDAGHADELLRPANTLAGSDEEATDEPA